MATINLKDLLAHARKNKYAVGAFNLTNLNFLDYFLEAAQEKNSPIIIQVAEVHLRYVNLEDIAPAIINAAKNVDIPVCIHLDHGESLKTVVRAIRSGFTSVMFDGSHHPFEENIKQTAEVVKIANSVGVSVEAELGYVGGEAIGEAAPISHAPDEEMFTKVNEAKEFYEQTNIDALAISIGNVHGFYKGEPNLDFKRLEDIAREIPIPLVLHGGSGISDEDFKKAISLGIGKINFYTQMSAAAVQSIREFLNQNPKVSSFPDVIKKGLVALKEQVKDRMDVFGSAGKCAADKSICISCDEEKCGLVDPKFQSSAQTYLYSDLIEKISTEVLNNIKKQ